jgi:hypothetical protein
MLLVVPVIAFGLADVAVDYALDTNPQVFNSLDPDVRGADNINVQIGVAVVFSVVLFSLFSILGSLIYSLAGGPRDEEIAARTKPGSFKR